MRGPKTVCFQFTAPTARAVRGRILQKRCMWHLENDKVHTKAWERAHALSHRAQRWHKPPLMRNVDHCWHPGCVLHVLLCIVGQFYKRAIAVNVETQDQVDGINHFLKGVLKVYIRSPQNREERRGGDAAETTKLRWR